MKVKFLNFKHLITFCGIVLLFIACKKIYFRYNYNDLNSLVHSEKEIHERSFLKAHLKNGDIVIFNDEWNVDSTQSLLKGIATVYDYNRQKVDIGLIHVSIDSILIFETNKKLPNRESDRLAALGIQTAINVISGIICLTVPKACFGSCPTFYVHNGDYIQNADAEGFSNAISPSLEYFDIDALEGIKLVNGQFNLLMKNEALETHCIREVKILACPKNKEEKIYQTRNNEFLQCKNKYPISKANATNKDITDLVDSQDKNEWFSLADANNLNSREEIILDFNQIVDRENLGLVIHFRQSLMTTYFIYSGLGYMGDEVSDAFAKIESDKSVGSKLESGIAKELGDLDVYAWNEANQSWEFQSGVYETGPIAINKQIIPLKSYCNVNNIKLKLVLNKGLWRIDYLGLTNIMKKVEPITLLPFQLDYEGIQEHKSLNHILDTTRHLISMPGDEYKFYFQVPNSMDQEYDYFLYSKGYYLEWMREHWLKDKDQVKLFDMVYRPSKYLKEEASSFKQYESQMESIFWNSKIDTKTVSYYEK